ncbi:MAG: putative rane protein [Herbinix sp.]|jgi:uncharacterized membrane protein|nr:putative rane protein [Herbinix sp.]
MNKTEFLNILRQSLSGEVTTGVIEQNINYYDGYISAQTAEDDDRIIDRLGDPRLIAKTIIEAEKAAREKSNGNWSKANHQGYATGQEEEYKEKSSEYNRSTFSFHMKWYQKLIVVAVIIILIIIIALVGRLLLGFLFAFGLPILLLLLVMSIFRKR